MVDFIDKLTFKMFGRKVPVFSVKDVDHGRVKAIQLGDWQENPNTLLDKWDSKGSIKTNDGLITFIDPSGLQRQAYVQYLGKTVDLFVNPQEDVPNNEKVVGSLLTIDILAELLDMGKSMKNVALGILIGAPIWWIVFQILGAMAK